MMGIQEEAAEIVQQFAAQELAVEPAPRASAPATG